MPYALRVVGVAALYINYELLFRSFSVIISKLDCLLFIDIFKTITLYLSTFI